MTRISYMAKWCKIPCSWNMCNYYSTRKIWTCM